MGAVYEVRHTANDKRWALKLMHPEFARNAEARERFAREAKIDALIESAFVVSVIDAGIDEGSSSPYLVMEFLVGEELGEHLERVGRCSPEATARYLTQVSRGLDKAHAKKIVHRDLKPENLFLCQSDEEGERVKILDFGIAKLMQTAAPQTTQGGGTPLYMAPEQTRRGREIGPWTDIWAFGLLAYTLLVGRSYWEAETVGELFGELLSPEPRDLPSRRAAQSGVSLPQAFDDWFFLCVQNDPAQRFASAGAAAAALANALRSPVSGASPVIPTVPAVSRPKLPVVVSAHTLDRTQQVDETDLIFDTVVGQPPGVHTTVKPVIAQPPPLPSKRPPAGMRRTLVLAAAALGVSGIGSTYYFSTNTGELELMVTGPNQRAVSGLEIWIDGAKRCTASPCRVRDLADGGHLLRVTGFNHEPAPDEYVRIARGQVFRKQLVLSEKMGALRVQATTWGTVWLSLDGKRIGPLPQELIELGAGEHSVSLDGGERYFRTEQRVTVEAGQATVVEPKLKVKKGLATIKAGSNAEGAYMVLVKGTERRPIPQLPLRVDLQADAGYRLVATKAGFRDLETPLVFEDGQAERTFVIALERAAPNPNVDAASGEGKPTLRRSACGCSPGDLQCAMRCAAD